MGECVCFSSRKTTHFSKELASCVVYNSGMVCNTTQFLRNLCGQERDSDFPKREKTNYIQVTLHRMWAHAPDAVCVCT